jgi:enterobactin synthetase component D
LKPAAVRSPALFPVTVAQHSIAYRPDDATHLAEQFPGVALPPSLTGAVRRRQADFLAGRWCARAALRACGSEHADEPIGIGAGREPSWPEGMVGTITHCHVRMFGVQVVGHAVADAFASAAVARIGHARAIGLDAERLIPEKDAGALVAQIAAVDEHADLVRATGWSPGLALTAAFSAKEAIFKCLYPEVRRLFDFRDARIEAFDVARGTFYARLLTALTAELPAGRVLEGRFEIGDALLCTGMLIPA